MDSLARWVDDRPLRDRHLLDVFVDRALRLPAPQQAIHADDPLVLVDPADTAAAHLELDVVAVLARDELARERTEAEGTV